MIELLMKALGGSGQAAGNILGGIGEDVIDSFGSAKDSLGGFADDPMGSLMDMRSIDHLKALTQSPEEYQKWLLDNPEDTVASRPMGIPKIPEAQAPYAPPQLGFINQQPNFLNSSQQILSGGPYG